MAHPTVAEESAVFVHDGDTAVGAVREVRRGADDFLIDVENGGAFYVPFSAVRESGDGKVVLDCGRLEPALRRAIGHAHDAEDTLAPDRPLPGEKI